MNKENIAPALFIGHGSPENAILDNSFTRFLKNFGENISKPKAIVSISAHWLTKGTFVTAMERPKIIYDFYGFPDELYNIKYDVNGSPKLAEQIIDVVNNIKVSKDNSWGIDHGSWTVLKHLFPLADIPCVQLSIDYNMPPEYHYNIGKEIAKLRKNNIMILGSGNIVHNLSMINFESIDAKPYDWAVKFDDYVKRMILNKNHDALIEYKKMGKDSQLAVPTPDHYYPLLYVLGAMIQNDKISFPFEGFHNSSLSMRAVKFG